ncbi:MAG: hypothetical protein RRB13_07220 [bacterium]|nr:hypothetical protein [bacterium]
MKRLVLVLALLCWNSVAWAESYSALLEGGLKLRYEHRNQKSQQITGFSELSYHRDDRGRIEERLLNRKPEGKLFQEKHSLFDSRGYLLSYQEVDHRRGLKVTDLVQKGRLVSQVELEGKKRSFGESLAGDLVPFELLTLFLQKHLSEIKSKGDLNFKLYLPQLAFELEKKGMSRDMAKIDVVAKLEGEVQMDTVRGKAAVLELVVTPTNPMLQMLLPPEQSKFNFGYFAKAPHYLVYFSEAQTKSVLVEIEAPGP